MYIDQIPSDAKKIEGSYDYVDPRGNIYGIERRNNGKTGQPFIKTQQTVYGYKYCGINYIDRGRVSKRVHKIVAQAFIPNPDNLPIVMHKDNDKKNNCVTNLKWGTAQENSQQAVDDGLLVNAKGFEDSQSIPCECYDTLTNEHIGTYGSLHIAEKETGVTAGGIMFQLKNPDAPIRKSKYFVPYGCPSKPHTIVCQYDFDTDKEIGRFTTVGKACAETGIAQQTINAQIKLDKKPNWSNTKTYFKKLQLS